ncbi:MAG: tetratricopeptide repeat protein [Planctomycetota bacterium]
MFTTAAVARLVGISHSRLSTLLSRGQVSPPPQSVDGRPMWTPDDVTKLRAELEAIRSKPRGRPTSASKREGNRFYKLESELLGEDAAPGGQKLVRIVASGETSGFAERVFDWSRRMATDMYSPVAGFEELEALYTQRDVRADHALRLADMAALVPEADPRHGEFLLKELYYLRVAVADRLVTSRSPSERSDTIALCLRIAAHPRCDAGQHGRAMRCACEQANAKGDTVHAVALATAGIEKVSEHPSVAAVIAGLTTVDAVGEDDRHAVLALAGLYMARSFAQTRAGHLPPARADLDTGIRLMSGATTDATRTSLSLLLAQKGQNLESAGRYSESHEAFERALQVAPESNPIGRAYMLSGLGSLLSAMGNADATRMLQSALDLYRATPSPVGPDQAVGNVLVQLGNDAMCWSHFARAIDCYRQALEIQERRNDMRAAAVPAINLATLAGHLGLPDRHQLLSRASQLSRQRDEPWMRLYADLLAGEPQIDSTVIDAARAGLSTDGAPQRDIGQALIVVGERTLRQGDLQRAKLALGMAARPLTEFDAPWLEVGEWAIADGRRLLLSGEDCSARVRLASSKMQASPAWRVLALGLQARSLIAAMDAGGRDADDLLVAARECLARMESSLAERQADEDLRRSRFAAEIANVREVINEAAAARDEDRPPRLYFGHTWLEFDPAALRRMGSQLSADAKRSLELSNPDVRSWLQ